MVKRPAPKPAPRPAPKAPSKPAPKSVSKPVTKSIAKPITHNFAPGTPNWVKPLMVQASQKYGVPTEVLSAVAKHESGGSFDPHQMQIGGGLGRGMYQLDLGQQPVTEQQAFDPSFSTDYAAKLLSEGKNATGSWTDALKYYNAGPNYNSNNPGYNGQPVSQLAQGYANTVMSYVNQANPEIVNQGTPSMPTQTKQLAYSQPTQRQSFSLPSSSNAMPQGGGLVSPIPQSQMVRPPAQKPPPVMSMAGNVFDNIGAGANTATQATQQALNPLSQYLNQGKRQPRNIWELLGIA